MLHSLPAILEELERTLIQGEDPMPLIGSIRWSEIVDWPKDRNEANTIKQKVSRINEIIIALYSPLRATLMVLGSGAPYKAKGEAELPPILTTRIEAQA
ncbi:MAG: hypothetical protein LBH03_03700 [Holophagales bacterium]|jgi:hypothetical protein|nr:hypothetical protein [Holophagales bacterium]